MPLKTSKLTKPGCTAILLRDVPRSIVVQAKAAAASRGQTMKGFILEAIRREIANARNEVQE